MKSGGVDLSDSKLVTLKLAGNQLLSFPNDRMDVLASLLHLDVSRNHIDHLPTHLLYLYRVQQATVFSLFSFFHERVVL